MLKNNNYYYEDKYMFFTFKGIHSKKYKLFISNSDYSFISVASDGVSIQFETPQYQNYSYFLGANRTQKKINLSLAAEGLSMAEISEISSWLNEGSQGFLYFDYNIDWGYDVVVNKLGDFEIYSNNGKLILNFTIDFITYGTYLSRSPWTFAIDIDQFKNTTATSSTDNKTILEQTINNGYGIPELYANFIDEQIDLFFPIVGNAYTYFDFSYKPIITNEKTSSLIIKDDDKKYIDYSFNHAIDINGNENIIQSNIKYYGNNNFIIENDSNLVELILNRVIKGTQNNGLLFFEGISPIELDIVNLTYDQNFIYLNIQEEVYSKISIMDNFYISMSFEDKENKNIYNIDSYDNKEYPYNYFSWIGFNPEITKNSELYTIKIPFNYRVFNDSFMNYGKPLLYCGNYKKITIINENSEEHTVWINKYNKNNL